MENLRTLEADDYLQNSEYSFSEERIQDFENDQNDKGNRKNIADPETVVREIESLFLAEGDKLIDSLTYYALKKIKEYAAKKSLAGMEPRELVQITIEKVLYCDRRWYMDKVKNIKSLLYLGLLSEIRNESRKLQSETNSFYDIHSETNPKNIKAHQKKERKQTRKVKPKIINLSRFDEYGGALENTIADIHVAKEHTRIDLELEKSAEEIGEFFDELGTEFEEKNDVIAGLVLIARRETDSNIAIAKELGIEVNEVESALKRIKNLGRKKRQE